MQDFREMKVGNIMSRLSGEQVKLATVILRLLIIWMSQFLMERLLLLLDP